MNPPERALCIAPGIAASLAVADRAGSVAAIILPAEALPRSGPGRLHATLCRRLAAAGIPAMRIDPPRVEGEDVLPPAACREHPPERDSILAMDALERATGIGRFLLIGAGAGAHGAFQAALGDPRVAGIAMVNPHDFVGDPAWSAMVLVQRYLQRSSRSMRSWIKLVNGRADYRRIATTLLGRLKSWASGADAEAAARAQAIAMSMRSLITRGCRVLCLVTDSHTALDHTRALFGTLYHGGFQSVTIRGADHLLRTSPQREEAIGQLVAWAAACQARRAPADGLMDPPLGDLGGKQLA